MAFDSRMNVNNGIVTIALSGELDASSAPVFRDKIEQASGPDLRRLVLDMTDLEYMSSAGLRVLVFAKQKMGQRIDIYVVGAQPQVVEPIRQTGMHHSMTLLDSYDAEQIEKF